MHSNLSHTQPVHTILYRKLSSVSTLEPFFFSPVTGKSCKGLVKSLFSFFSFMTFNLSTAITTKEHQLMLNYKGFLWDCLLQLLWCKAIQSNKCFRLNTKYTHDYVAIYWKCCQSTFYLKGTTHFYPLKNKILCSLGLHTSLFMWVKRMLPPCPFNMFSLKFSLLPLGPFTYWW